MRKAPAANSLSRLRGPKSPLLTLPRHPKAESEAAPRPGSWSQQNPHRQLRGSYIQQKVQNPEAFERDRMCSRAEPDLGHMGQLLIGFTPSELSKAQGSGPLELLI